MEDSFQEVEINDLEEKQTVHTDSLALDQKCRTIPIDNELKQIIATRTEENITISSLKNEMDCLEPVINNLLDSFHREANFDLNLSKHLESDEAKFCHIKEFVLKFHKNCREILKQYKLVEKDIQCLKQHDLLNNCKRHIDETNKLKTELQDKFNKEETELKANHEQLLSTLNKKEHYLENLKLKHLVNLKRISELDETIQKQKLKKLKLLKELDGDEETEGILASQNIQIKKLQLEIEQQNETLKRLFEREMKLKNEITNRESYLKKSKEKRLSLMNEIEEKRMCVSKEEEEIKKIEEEIELKNEKITEQQIIYNENKKKMYEIEEKNKEIKKKIEKCGNDFILLFEEQSNTLKPMLDQKNITNQMEAMLKEKKAALITLKERKELICKQKEDLQQSIAKCDEEILKEKENNKNKLDEATKKYFNLVEKKKIIKEKEKSKEYLLISNEYLKEKLQNMQDDLNNFKSRNENVNKEIANLTKIVEAKQKTLQDLKNQKSFLENAALKTKSLLKSPGKQNNSEKAVTFNEHISFKSITESESSFGENSQTLDELFNSLK